MTAGAYALDGQYGPCMLSFACAHDMLTTGSNVAESPAYWVHHGSIDSHASSFLTLLGKPAEAVALLGKPREAVDAAIMAQTRFNRTYIGLYARCQVRLGHALVLDKDITQAAQVLGDAASHASMSPRLATELHTARALMQPWKATHAVKTLDAQLEACGFMSNQS